MGEQLPDLTAQDLPGRSAVQPESGLVCVGETVLPVQRRIPFAEFVDDELEALLPVAGTVEMVRVGQACLERCDGGSRA